MASTVANKLIFNLRYVGAQKSDEVRKEWTNANLSPNLTVKRINTLGKKCVGF